MKGWAHFPQTHQSSPDKCNSHLYIKELSAAVMNSGRKWALKNHPNPLIRQFEIIIIRKIICLDRSLYGAAVALKGPAIDSFGLSGKKPVLALWVLPFSFIFVSVLEQ
ncbi:hypothetical protein HUJ04_001996 [Dendroctonus ponderosae]|nr:hypothetical protein HUJ04_001996 [Dendroctonus ponderosae]